MRKSWTRLPLNTVLLGAIPLALLAGAWFVAKATIDHLLYHDAVTTGRNWTAYIAENVKDLEQIAQGAKPSPDSQRFLERARKAGQVFRYVIYDPAGHSRFISDSLDKDNDDDEALGEHNPAAAQAIARGEPLVSAEDGEPPTRPSYFSEAYLPAQANGKTVAIVETYVDQTDKRVEYGRTVVFTSAALFALIAIAFGVPGLAWLRRSNEKRVAEAHIQYLADHDALTGLLNRDRLGREAAAALAVVERSNGRLAIHAVDIDHFKDINDTLGHDAGDRLIVGVAGRLKTLAGPRDFVARLGGDEFMILQTGAANDEAIAALAADIRRQIARPFESAGQATSVTASVGIAIAPRDGDSFARLEKSAALALDHSKKHGRNLASFFSKDFDEALAERLRLERAIRATLASDGFELYYQPTVEMPTGRLVGFEALLRMRDENGVMVSPAIFVPLAEQMGLIDRIGEWVLREACGTAQLWPAELKVAVNLSPAQFARDGLTGRVAEILAQTGLEAARLELEITEGLLLKRSDAVMEELRRLKALGVSIVMDDFGTGYSSLSYLWQFPFDKIKIDRAFMVALEGEDRGNAATIIKTIVDLGRSLKVIVTVEGVESARQVAFVTAARCDQIQGFYFGRPMPQADLAAHIAVSHAVGADRRDGKAASVNVA